MEPPPLQPPEVIVIAVLAAAGTAEIAATVRPAAARVTPVMAAAVDRDSKRMRNIDALLTVG